MQHAQIYSSGYQLFTIKFGKLMGGVNLHGETLKLTTYEKTNLRPCGIGIYSLRR